MPRFIKIFIVVIALVVAYWLISPLFIDIKIDEELVVKKPDTTTTSTTNLNEQISGDEMDEFMDAMKQVGEAEEMKEDMPTAPESQIFATGSFVSVAHEGTGDVKIINLGTESGTIVRFENLDILNGPDLRVLLSKSTDVKKSGDLGEYIELGKLKGNQGNQNYEVPENLDLSMYNTVIIYCKPFHVVFNVAKLER